MNANAVKINLTPLTGMIVSSFAFYFTPYLSQLALAVDARHQNDDRFREPAPQDQTVSPTTRFFFLSLLIVIATQFSVRDVSSEINLAARNSRMPPSRSHSRVRHYQLIGCNL